MIQALLLSGLLGVPLWAGNKDLERLYLQVAALQSEVAQLRRATDDTLREVKRLNEVLAEQNAYLKKGALDQQRQTEAVGLAMKEISDALAALRERSQPAAPNPAALVEGAALPQPLASGGGVPPGGEMTAPAPPAAGELYTQAYADFARGDYDLAIQEFQQYLQHYPSLHLADNAQFWIGECLYGKQQYTEAIAAWDTLFRQYPGTDKIPDARYKKAMALERVGRRSQALLEYRYVMEHFPNSEAGRKAKEKVRAQ
jgi:tol-pal system protein YbgF